MAQTISARCCVVGGGPAGLMAGFLLARAGVETIVLEKHADFLRDFRGDTIHPSTLQLMFELGLLDAFLKLPHRKAFQLSAWVGGRKFVVADFRAPADLVQIRRLHAAVGFSRLHRRRGEEAAEFPPADEDRGRWPPRGGRPRHRRARVGAGGAARDLRRSHRSPRTGGPRCCAKRPASRWRISARRWMCCGSSCGARRMIRTRPSAAPRRAAWSR